MSASNKIAEAYVEIGATMRPFDVAMRTIRNSLSGLAAMRFRIPGGGVLGALGLAGAGIEASRAIRGSVSGASDLAETMSKVEVTFGDSAKVVTSAADSMAKAFGIPKREFLDAASMFGLIATGSGLAETEAAKMSSAFAKLAADAASFYNVPVDVALEKIRAGLTGESEPLKAFGVLMSEEGTKAMALAMGISRTGKELSNQQKFMARAEVITRGLSRANGDLERTQDGAANQSRKFWGALQNLGDTIGTVVLPAFTELIRLANDVVTDMSAAAEKSGSAWGRFVSSFRSAIQTAGTIYRNWGNIVERTGILIGGTLQNIVERLLWLKDTAGAFLSWFGSAWKTVFKDAFEAVLTALRNLGQNFANFGQAAYDWIVSGFQKPFEMKFTPLMEGFQRDPAALGILQAMQNMPQLKLTSFQDQLEAIDNRMLDTEQKKADAEAAKGKGGAGKVARANLPEPPEKQLKSEFVGLAEFAKKIQAGSLDKKDKAAEDTARNTGRAVGLLGDLLRNSNRGGGHDFAVAAGPA